MYSNNGREYPYKLVDQVFSSAALLNAMSMSFQKSTDNSDSNILNVRKSKGAKSFKHKKTRARVAKRTRRSQRS